MWDIRFCPEAVKDLKKLDNSLKKQVLAGIRKVSHNPVSQHEGGYGKPLGHINGDNLTGFFKIKYKRIGIRVVYTLVKERESMNIIVISIRDDEECYKLANRRKNKYGRSIFLDIFMNKQ